MVNDIVNTMLKNSKLYTDATEIDSSDTITDNLKIVYDKLNKLNKNMKAADNEDMLNMLKQIKMKVDSNSKQLTELKNTLI